MNRRTLLSTLAVCATGVTAGCGYRLTGPIERRTFDICDGDCDWTDRTPEAGGNPNVVRDAAENRIVVYGHVYVGSGSCDRAVLDSARVRDGTLQVVVADGNKGILPNLACTGDMSADQYRALFSFRDTPPERIVEENGPMDSRITVTPED